MKLNRGSVALWQTCGSIPSRIGEMCTSPLDKITQGERKSYETYFPYSKI
jgi:hypothetical protein